MTEQTMNQLIKGKHAVMEAMNSDAVEVDRIMISFLLKGKADISQILNIAKEKKIKIQFLSPKTITEQFPDEDNSQGIFAYTLKFSFYGIENLIKDPENHQKVVILDHIQDPHNFGAILRTCECFGFKNVIFPKDRNAQLSPTVSKTSAGAYSHLNLIRVTNLHQSLMKLKKAGYWIYGTCPENGQALNQIKAHTPFAIIIGNEHKGLSPLLKKVTDDTIYIPMSGNIQSLNASVSTGVVLYGLNQSQS
ncbi:23S rRNA (guanosine(2251)-2'-O)-methyltransferase RlmB [bacterium]|jgi:23S rRNA (guanosine2251-2'-O)-methyltransferase|nr:23S rRNA (guanosine(2251)-2'-O)-methyltransferase RlmB [bacterium]